MDAAFGFFGEGEDARGRRGIFAELKLALEQAAKFAEEFAFEELEGGRDDEVIAGSAALDFVKEPDGSVGGFAGLGAGGDDDEAGGAVVGALLAGMELDGELGDVIWL